MKRKVENQLTLDYFQSKLDNNRPDGCEDEYPCYMHTEQQAVDNSVLEINSPAGMIKDINTDWSQAQDIGCKKDGPAQLLTLFPAKPDCNKRKTNRFQASWYSKHPWITYSESQDKAFCFSMYTLQHHKVTGQVYKKGIS
ncbi:hypothetical protein LOD99_11950 [Oopsacas minuta]|uniref:Uncharacterized protein n=1 Tax=Oopsacas minuta TaxID=111878 RepID=A0AAV7JHE0_9METZ|nr:hypothetical protein LOD99_11950 [Oopsacas minuta]